MNDRGREEPAEPDIQDIDEGRNTWIILGCYRETFRLERMLRVYRVALTLARREEDDKSLVDHLVSLHDHKGYLTAGWTESAPTRLRTYVEEAWKLENEVNIQHDIVAWPKALDPANRPW